MAHEFQITNGTHVYSRKQGYQPAPAEEYRVFQNANGGWTAELNISVDAPSAEAAHQQVLERVRTLPVPAQG